MSKMQALGLGSDPACALVLACCSIGLRTRNSRLPGSELSVLEEDNKKWATGENVTLKALPGKELLFCFLEVISVSHGCLWGPGPGIAVGESGRPAWETKNRSCLEHFGGISPSLSFPNVG